MRQIIPTESDEASVLVAYLRIRGYRFHHSPNETGGTAEAKRRAIRVKREGTSKGFPDYVVIVGNRLVFIELKRTQGSTTSPEQKEWIKALSDAGQYARICKGSREAVEYIESVNEKEI